MNTTYIYPHNLKSKANLWLWSLRDFSILCICALLSVVALARLFIVFPLALTIAYAFVSIRLEDFTVLDYIRFAGRFFISSQQLFYWRNGGEV